VRLWKVPVVSETTDLAVGTRPRQLIVITFSSPFQNLYTTLIGPQSCSDLYVRMPVPLYYNQLPALMSKNHFPFTCVWRDCKWRVWSESFPSNAAVAPGPSEWRTLVPRSAPTLKWSFEEVVSLLIFLQKTLKENKRKHK
jgi:hypothetical protein